MTERTRRLGPRRSAISLVLAVAAIAGCATEASRAPDVPFLAALRNASGPSFVAFSPTNHDPRPASRRIPPRDSVREDLQALRPAFEGLILYGYDRDVTPAVLAEAKALGYRAVLLGIWNPGARHEIEGTVALVEQYRADLAIAVCIGNEGITFGRYTIEDLVAAAEELRRRLRQIPVPLTTSEPLSGYHRIAVREFGDFLAPNIHPVFDAPQLGPAPAAMWARERAATLAETARKPVLVKETGFPHGGQDRFSPAAQASFWETYLAQGRIRVVRPNVWVSYAAGFEGLDLPWKAEETGNPIEGAWGLLAIDRTARPAFRVWRAAPR